MVVNRHKATSAQSRHTAEAQVHAKAIRIGVDSYRQNGKGLGQLQSSRAKRGGAVDVLAVMKLRTSGCRQKLSVAKCATPGLMRRSAIGTFIAAATSRKRAPQSTKRAAVRTRSEISIYHGLRSLSLSVINKLIGQALEEAASPTTALVTTASKC
jgi:hypothetical protein